MQFTEKDMFAPRLSKLNMNKKIRGGKKLNECPIVTYTDASRLLQGLELTWRDVAVESAGVLYLRSRSPRVSLDSFVLLKPLNKLAEQQSMQVKTSRTRRMVLCIVSC